MNTNNDMMATIADLLVKAMVERLLNDEAFIQNIVSQAVAKTADTVADLVQRDTDERIESALNEFTVDVDNINGLTSAIENEISNIELDSIPGFAGAVEEAMDEYKFNADQIEDLDDNVLRIVSRKLAD